MRKLLFRDSRCYEVGKMVKELWTQRRKLLKNTQDRQIINIPDSAIDSEQSRDCIRSRSDPGPRIWGTRGNRLRNRSLSKGQITSYAPVVQYRVPVVRQRFTCGTPHKHGVPASRLTELIARRTHFGMATATKEKLQTVIYHQSPFIKHLSLSIFIFHHFTSAS